MQNSPSRSIRPEDAPARSGRVHPAAEALGRVLIVEDDPRLRTLIADFLRDEGFAVVAVATGIEALDSINRDPPGVVLLDVHLPGMSGAELAQELKEREISVPIVVMTAAHDASAWAHEMGAAAYVAKPVSLPLLLHRLDGLAA
jgi:two-component system response regulator MtrA